MDNLVTEGLAFKPDGLFVGSDLPTLVKGVSLKAGQGFLKRGSVICQNADGHGELVSKTNIKPAGEVPGFMVVGVLTDDTITAESTGATVATIYQMGYFNADALVFAEGTVLADVARELREMGILTGAIKGV